MTGIPKRLNHLEIEEKFVNKWEESGIFNWDGDRPRKDTFVVDTPPPTVSGSLHIGHVFSYTHTDLIVRYQRMRGKNIMYPMGWDDNGLPTERRVQNKFGIRCNPHLPYIPSWSPEEVKGTTKGFKEVSRRNFIEACAQVTAEDEQAFEELWRRLGLSISWNEQYSTMDSHCLRVSQYSFLDLVKKGFIYQEESPTMWDVDYQTALAQADLEDRLKPGAYHDIRFATVDGEEFVISTTRPELLVSCIAVVAHPNDKRYQSYFGKKAITPLFGAEVPIVPSEHADPDKGSGIMMVCTFGDVADVDWWKTSNLPIKQSLGRDGRFLELDFRSNPFLSVDPGRAESAYALLAGKTTRQARSKIAELLMEDGSGTSGRGKALIAAPKPIEHPVKFYEKGDRPIEFVTTRQWFIRILDHKEQLLKQGDKVSWHPEHMKTRYQHWVNGISHDWCISRQRFFGVPFPVWYPVKGDGSKDFENPIFADISELPVDPLSGVPQGFEESQRDQPGGFSGDPDVMDTWATSSLTPQIISGWGEDSVRHKKLFPADIRPQSHEIIRTWAFYTIAKSWMHEEETPWKNVVISGWILDPDRKKMSKSKGNVVTPKNLLDKYSSDAVRYWAARARLGVDTTYDEAVFKSGQKLTNKIFNASRFVVSQLNESGFCLKEVNANLVNEAIDQSFIAQLKAVVIDATDCFENLDYAAALQLIEDSFWAFCDHYLELTKGRAYGTASGQARKSALATLSWAIRSYLRLFAPFLPYVTDEIWSWGFSSDSGRDSIHTSAWPTPDEMPADIDLSNKDLLSKTSALLGEIRAAKSNAQKSLRWPVKQLVLRGSKESLNLLKPGIGDLERAGRILQGGVLLEEFPALEDGEFETVIELATDEEAN